jgi:malate dehydrogenase (oxaloacetate-decarboxylating)
MLGRVAMAIGDAGGDIGAVDLVESGRDRIVRDITISSRDSDHSLQIVNRLKHLGGVRIVNTSDRTFLMHLGGKIEIHNKVPIRTRDDLSMAYTPGVARVCMAIREDRQRAFALTMKHNAVAVVTDGTAVLGLGDIGPEAALPVMEGKAMLFKEFGGVDAFPICLATKDPAKIVETVKHWPPPSAGSTWRTSALPAVSRSSGGSTRRWTFLCSTTTSTGPRLWSWPRCATPPHCSGARSRRCGSW